MNKLLLSIALCAFALVAMSQTDYKVERDTEGQFLLLQNGSKTVFDTAYVATSLDKKIKEEKAIQTEIDLIDRLILLRRQLAIVTDERKTLEDILKKSRDASKTP